MAHDPIRFLSSLGAKLATRSRHVCFFFGAGTSRAGGLPDIDQLTTRIIAALDPVQSEKFTLLIKDGGLERALSRLRALQAMLREGQILDGMTAHDAACLDSLVCSLIIQELDVKSADLVPARKFASWVRRSQYRLPIEVFTVNYDLILESAFDRHSVHYFDGFSGVLRARFHTDLVENSGSNDKEGVPSFFARLWKLHGSVNWVWDDSEVIRLGAAAESGQIAAIYPSDAKYDQSRRFPYVVLQDRFRRALNQPETLLIISGYAFGDQHINEMIFDAAARRERSEFIVLSFDPISDEIAKRASHTPNLQVVHKEEAILGGVRAPWAVDDVSSPYWQDSKMKLPDFRSLADFLGQISVRTNEADSALKDLSAEIAAQISAATSPEKL
ncbi:MAG: SIR2 family protein [Lysobacter sp.]|nr:SIR2 family protein [Lysobacter sp.]